MCLKSRICYIFSPNHNWKCVGIHIFATYIKFFFHYKNSPQLCLNIGPYRYYQEIVDAMIGFVYSYITHYGFLATTLDGLPMPFE